MWRKAGGQYPLCNACGVSKRAHGVDRKLPPEVAAESEFVLAEAPEMPASQEDSAGDDTTIAYAPFQGQMSQVRSILKQTLLHMHGCQEYLVLSENLED